MPRTADQEARAQAWARVFEDGPAATAVLDDLTEFAKSLPETQTAGAASLLLHILSRRSQIRREKARGGKEASRHA